MSKYICHEYDSDQKFNEYLIQNTIVFPQKLSSYEFIEIFKIRFIKSLKIAESA